MAHSATVTAQDAADITEHEQWSSSSAPLALSPSHLVVSKAARMLRPEVHCFGLVMRESLTRSSRWQPL